MNTLAKILFILLVIIGTVFFIISYDPSTGKIFPPAIWMITTIGGYFIAAAGIVAGAIGAIGFLFERNPNFWQGFQPVNVGVPIAVWSFMGIYKECSWELLASVAIVLILILNFAWKNVVKWRVLPASLMLIFIFTADIRGAMKYAHLGIAATLIFIPIGLILKHHLHVRSGDK
jgi:hypothetical protein